MEQAYIRAVKVEAAEGQATVTFDASPGLRKYFTTDRFTYWMEGCQDVPQSLLAVPFVCNVLPLVWLADAVLCVDELDKAFYESISRFKQGYVDMYPALAFKGRVQAGKLVANEWRAERNLVLFSGGIDAICTTLRHKAENPLLLTLWGSADFPTDDERGWKLHWENITHNAALLGLECGYLKTGFCDFIPLWGKELAELISPVHGEWWHDMQHGIGILGHTAPYAYLHRAGTVYIASSFDASRKPYMCASDPTIDNHVRFGSSTVCHDGYELTRQDKIGYIARRLAASGTRLRIHVCLRQYQQENCCRCEKCYRTLLGMLAEGMDPNLYGFRYRPADLKRIFGDLKYRIVLGGKIQPYKKIKARVLENQANLADKELVAWFARTDIDRLDDNLPKYYRRFRRKVGAVLRSLKLMKR